MLFLVVFNNQEKSDLFWECCIYGNSHHSYINDIISSKDENKTTVLKHVVFS